MRVLTNDTSSSRSQDAFTSLDAACEAGFGQFILQRTGIVLQSHQWSNLRDTVRKGCERFTFRDAGHYLDALKQSTMVTAPFEYLIAGVTVGESYFFRDSDQMELLRNQLLPEMLAAKRASGNLSLRIWSAGCAQGQEIYSIAILLHELIPDIEKWHIHLMGTDINTEVVAKAIQGCYSEWSFRSTHPRQRERWFARVNQEHEIQPSIRRMVRFGYLNLAVDTYPSILNETNALDLILCRNVFIYLDAQAVQRSMTQFSHCLVDGGVVLLGASDPIHYHHEDLELIQNARTGYFRKVNSFTESIPACLETNPRILAEISSQVEATLVENARPRVLENQLQVNADKRNTDEEVVTLAQLINDARWHEAMVQVDSMLQKGHESSDVWQKKAKILASTGSLDLALAACEHSLKLDAVNKSSYFLMGLVLAELDRVDDAAEAFRKTLYLDHSFLEAHYELGMLRVRGKDLVAAFKSFENALRLAKKGDPAWKLHNSAGMTYGRFAQVLENEIEMLRDAKGSQRR